MGGKALSCIGHHLEKQNWFETWRLLYKEHKPDVATRKVGLQERVMDDQLAPGADFGDWFLWRSDLVGECEQACGRMIDDDVEIAVMLKRSCKELRDHHVLEGPQFANVENKYARACPARVPLTNNFPQQPPMEVDSDTTVSALGWYGS